MTTDRLQEGIYFRSGQAPPACYRLLLFNADQGARVSEVREALGRVLGMLRGLIGGELRELTGTNTPETEITAESFRGLDVLIGFGRRFFDEGLHEPALTQHPRPDHLSYLDRDREPFPALPWTRGVPAENLGEADVALQLTGPTDAAVNRAGVEVWKLVVDEDLPLEPVAFHEGFARPDGRGWLEFHDGVSNMPSNQRGEAVVAGADPGWMEGGTYMAFLRFAVDLRVWRELSRAQQELVIGRDKLSGAPLVGVERRRGGEAAPIAAPALGEASSSRTHADYADPPQTTDPLMELSHIHRANQNRASPYAPGGLRIFRQGYDFLDSIGPEGPLLGLNFVSFQGDLGSLQHLLHRPGWLGDVNFGGPVDPQPGDPPSPQLISLLAGGFYAVPPRADPFPGADLLGT